MTLFAHSKVTNKKKIPQSQTSASFVANLNGVHKATDHPNQAND
jgi:hypothetical protein